jgi:hypothetical protein
MKETHYIVKTPGYPLSKFWCELPKTKYFPTLERAEKWIDKQIKDAEKYSDHYGLQPEEIQAIKFEAHRKLSFVRPIAFEVEVPEYL